MAGAVFAAAATGRCRRRPLQSMGGPAAAQNMWRWMFSVSRILLPISSIEVWVVLPIGRRSARISFSAAATSRRHCSRVA